MTAYPHIPNLRQHQSNSVVSPLNGASQSPAASSLFATEFHNPHRNLLNMSHLQRSVRPADKINAQICPNSINSLGGGEL